MTVVRHPTLDVIQDVPESKLAEWLAAGWRTDASITEIKTLQGDIIWTAIETDAGQLEPTKPKSKPKK